MTDNENYDKEENPRPVPPPYPGASNPVPPQYPQQPSQPYLNQQGAPQQPSQPYTGQQGAPQYSQAPNQMNQQWQPQPPKKSNKGLIIALSVIGGFVVLALIVGATLIPGIFADRDKDYSPKEPTTSQQPTLPAPTETPEDEPGSTSDLPVSSLTFEEGSQIPLDSQIAISNALVSDDDWTLSTTDKEAEAKVTSYTSASTGCIARYSTLAVPSDLIVPGDDKASSTKFLTALLSQLDATETVTTGSIGYAPMAFDAGAKADSAQIQTTNTSGDSVRMDVRVLSSLKQGILISTQCSSPEVLDQVYPTVQEGLSLSILPQF